MGVDLTLLPLLSKDYWVAHTKLDVERRRDLWEPITQLPQQPIPAKLGCYMAHDAAGETCYGDIEEDPYGSRLQWTTAGTLASLKDHEEVQDNWQNKAVWSYLAEMPTDWPIVLYWR